MPGATPNFAIPYPCAGENITPAVFSAFATGVENALTTVDALSAQALNRPNATILASGTSIPFGPMANLVFTSTPFTNGIVTPGTGFTIPRNGLYMVTLETGSNTVPTTVTSWSAEILVAGATRYRRKLSQITSVPPAPDADELNVSGLIYATTGQAVTFQFGWTGTGINLVVTARASISLTAAV